MEVCQKRGRGERAWGEQASEVWCPSALSLSPVPGFFLPLSPRPQKQAEKRRPATAAPRAAFRSRTRAAVSRRRPSGPRPPGAARFAAPIACSTWSGSRPARETEGRDRGTGGDGVEVGEVAAAAAATQSTEERGWWCGWAGGRPGPKSREGRNFLQARRAAVVCGVPGSGGGGAPTVPADVSQDPKDPRRGVWMERS